MTPLSGLSFWKAACSISKMIHSKYTYIARQFSRDPLGKKKHKKMCENILSGNFIAKKWLKINISGTNDKRYRRTHWHLLCINQLTILKPIPGEKGGTCSLGKLQNRWRDISIYIYISDISLLKLVLKSWCWVCQDVVPWIENNSSNYKTGVRRIVVYKNKPLEVKWRLCDVPLYNNLAT